MKTSCLFAILITWIWAPNLNSQVLTGPVTNPANGHEYYLLAATYWTNAEAQAISLGGHLVTINDAAENAWVLSTFGNFGGISRVLHIGFTDEGQEGQWRWVSSEPVTYVNWAGGEPNNGQGIFPFENQSVMYGEADARRGLWNDMIGSLAEQQYFGVVEVAPRVSIRVSEVELCWPTVTNVFYQVQYRTGPSTSLSSGILNLLTTRAEASQITPHARKATQNRQSGDRKPTLHLFRRSTRFKVRVRCLRNRICHQNILFNIQ